MAGVSDFLAMGGFAAFVWPAFALTLGLMGGFLALTFRRQRRAARDLEALQQATGRRGDDAMTEDGGA